MLSWFEKTAPIRVKFQALLIVHGLFGALALAGAVIAGSFAPAVGIVIAAVAMAGSVIAVSVSRNLICSPYGNTVVRMEGLAAGDLESPISYSDYQDCVGRMAKAMETFRDNARKVRELADGQHLVVESLSSGMEALASGDLTFSITTPFPAEYESLRISFNRAMESFESSLSQVAQSATSVHNGSTEIRAASEDLALRTEQQASSLEETTAAMSQVTDMVGETARGASDVRSAIGQAHKDATDGGRVVGEAVSAMDAIEKSSQEISQIINVIDGIAFQTNLLALNAGVEAARAGDAGKGFAVVANEVRALAQRSADAAKDIKALINTSTEQVGHGVALVGDTGKMLDRIVSKISDINALITEIASSTEQQAENLQHVNGAVSDMDKMTQQNAAMVEESTAAARSLASEADALTSLVSSFQLRGGRLSRSSAAPAPAPRKPAPAPRATPAPAAAAPRPMPQISGNLAVKTDVADDDWTEF